MSKSTSITEELLFSFFAGRATPLQKQMIEKWRADPANEELFYAVLHKWESENIQYRANVNEAILRFHADISDNKPAAVLPGKKQAEKVAAASYWGWGKWLVAASVLFVLGVNAYLFRSELLYKTYFTQFGQTSLITLSDGSKVMLNANSVLSVPRFGFGKATRNVFLQGEACFSVVHTSDNKRFVVQTDSLFNVEVLGTEFDVFARPRQTKVVLIKGKVNVHYRPENKTGPALTMAPGDLVTINKKQARLKVEKVEQPENYASWKQNRFIFDNTSLGEIKAIIRENYGLEVEMKGENLANRTVSGSFKAKSVEEFLESISQVLNINMIRQSNHVTLLSNQ